MDTFSLVNKRQARIFKRQRITKAVWQHIKENAKSKGIYLDCVNGYHDHVHCLMALKANQTIANNVRLIKGECTHWINKQKLTQSKFKWQEEYFAVSISHSMVERVRKYIHNQEEHHKKRTFADEYQDFILKYGFQKFKDLE